MSKKRVIVISLAVLAITGLGYTLTNKSGTQKNTATQQQPISNQAEQVSTGIQKGQLAPDFDFITIDNQTVKLSQFRGQPVIFGFVQTIGCTPCAIEAKNIKKVQESVPNLKVIQIAIVPIEPAKALANFRDFNGRPSWLIGYDKDEALTKLYNVRNVDTTVMIDAKGKIIYRDGGYPADVNELKTALGA